jgi:rod shape determining protein RodA
MFERRMLRNLDLRLLAAVLALMALSVVTIASATRTSGGAFFSQAVRQQMLWILVGLLAMAVMIFIDPGDLSRLSVFIYVVNLLALLAVGFLGSSVLGAQRWIPIGPFRLQPSELAKVFLAITLSASLARREGGFGGWRSFVMSFLHIAVPLGLILKQPDLGTSLVLLAVLFGILFFAGAPLGKLFGLYGAGIAAAVLAVVLHLRFGLPLPLKDYQLMRLIVFANPDLDPLQAGYHLRQSLIAVGSGRLFGKGLFAGVQSGLDFLPMRHTDFIYSVVAEELGLIGAGFLLILYLILVWRAVLIAGMARDRFCSLLAAGLAAMFAFHILVNVGMTIGIMPITGIPLPFMSYGGSAMLANCMAVGLLQSIAARRKKILF